jgi:hypothetical protein
MKRYQWRPALEAKHAALEREATGLLRTADSRARHQKPTSPSSPSPSPAVTPSKWIPPADWRALRRKERALRRS